MLLLHVGACGASEHAHEAGATTLRTPDNSSMLLLLGGCAELGSTTALAGLDLTAVSASASASASALVASAAHARAVAASAAAGAAAAAPGLSGHGLVQGPGHVGGAGGAGSMTHGSFADAEAAAMQLQGLIQLQDMEED